MAHKQADKTKREVNEAGEKKTDISVEKIIINPKPLSVQLRTAHAHWHTQRPKCIFNAALIVKSFVVQCMRSYVSIFFSMVVRCFILKLIFVEPIFGLLSMFVVCACTFYTPFGAFVCYIVVSFSTKIVAFYARYVQTHRSHFAQKLDFFVVFFSFWFALFICVYDLSHTYTQYANAMKCSFCLSLVLVEFAFSRFFFFFSFVNMYQLPFIVINRRNQMNSNTLPGYY